MGTEGKQGLGKRHSFTPIYDSPKEVAARQLAQAQRTIDRLESRLASIEGTLKIVNRLSAPFVANARKPEPRR
jgi:hypothetical protein